jgi:HlyD family secretion protein
MVAVGDSVLTIADLSRLRIAAEVDEFDATRVARGARAVVTAEGHPGTIWRATVEEVPDVVVGRRLRPQDPGRPIDARVLCVKVAFGEATRLKLGQKVEVQFPAAAAGSASEKIVARGH